MRLDGSSHAMFLALGDARRFFIFSELWKRRGGCVSEVASWCDFTVSAASQQLKALERGNLVVRRREGQRTVYDVNITDTAVRALIRIVE
jgi:DNA-binding transcriptional ArsR family regulator